MIGKLSSDNVNATIAYYGGATVHSHRKSSIMKTLIVFNFLTDEDKMLFAIKYGNIGDFVISSIDVCFDY